MSRGLRARWSGKGIFEIGFLIGTLKCIMPGSNPMAHIWDICMHAELDYIINTCSKPEDQPPVPIREGIHNLLGLHPGKMNYYLKIMDIIPQLYDHPASYLPCSCGCFHPRFLGITPKSDYLRLLRQYTIRRNVSISFQHLYGVPQTPQHLAIALLCRFLLIQAPGGLLVFVYTKAFPYKETMKMGL